MNDNEIYSVLVPFIRSNIAAYGAPVDEVRQSYQPTTQGTPSGPAVYLYKIGDNRYGHTRRTNVWDAATTTMVYTEIQQIETTFQLSGTSPQDPTLTGSLTASDVVNSAAMLLGSQLFIDHLRANGLQVYRISDVRNPAFESDRNRYEFNPNFDFVLTHDRQFAGTMPIVDVIECEIERI